VKDAGAIRAVLAFACADTHRRGKLSTLGAPHCVHVASKLTVDADISRAFGLDDDLFLARWLAVTSAADFSLTSFIVAVAQFCAAGGVAREIAIRRFAFDLLDVRSAGALHPQELQPFVATAIHSFRTKPGAWEGVDGAATRTRQAMSRIEARCVGGFIRSLVFEQLCTELPLLIAPAMLIWSTFEDHGPACERICGLMVAQGHGCFAMVTSRGTAQKLALAKETHLLPDRPIDDVRRRPAPLVVDPHRSSGGDAPCLSSRGQPLKPANDEFPSNLHQREPAHLQPAGKSATYPPPHQREPDPAVAAVPHRQLPPRSQPAFVEPSDAELASILALADKPRPPGVSRLSHASSQRIR